MTNTTVIGLVILALALAGCTSVDVGGGNNNCPAVGGTAAPGSGGAGGAGGTSGGAGAGAPGGGGNASTGCTTSTTISISEAAQGIAGSVD